MIVPEIVQNKWKSEPSATEIMKSQLSETRADLQTIRTQLEGDLQTIRTQLGDTQTQLGDTQTQLETTRTELEHALEAEKVKTKNLESRITFLETAVASLIS